MILTQEEARLWGEILIGFSQGKEYVYPHTYDSYAGDGDCGFDYCWTGRRKTWKELRYYNKFGWDDDGYFQFILPFFLAWLIVLPGTIVCEVRQELEMRRYDKDWREGKI